MRIERQEGFPFPGEPGLFWLGQAGFFIETGMRRLLIDPYLGYEIEANGLRLYRSGNFIPFEGLGAPIADFSPQIALSPVNDRDEERLAHGIPGNFTLEEAISLSAGIAYLIPHHFGMFAFNAIDAAWIDGAARSERAGKIRILRPDAGGTLRIFP